MPTFHLGRRADRPERLALLDADGVSHCLFPLDYTPEQAAADLRAAGLAERRPGEWVQAG